MVLLEVPPSWVYFINCYLAAPQPAMGYYRGGSLIHAMLITMFSHFRPKGHCESPNKVGSLIPHLPGLNQEPSISDYSTLGTKLPRPLSPNFQKLLSSSPQEPGGAKDKRTKCSGRPPCSKQCLGRPFVHPLPYNRYGNKVL